MLFRTMCEKQLIAEKQIDCATEAPSLAKWWFPLVKNLFYFYQPIPFGTNTFNIVTLIEFFTR